MRHCRFLENGLKLWTCSVDLGWDRINTAGSERPCAHVPRICPVMFTHPCRYCTTHFIFIASLISAFNNLGQIEIMSLPSHSWSPIIIKSAERKRIISVMLSVSVSSVQRSGRRSQEMMGSVQSMMSVSLSIQRAATDIWHRLADSGGNTTAIFK